MLQRAPSLLPSTVDTDRRPRIYESGIGSSQTQNLPSAFILDLPAFRMWEVNVWCFKPPILWIFCNSSSSRLRQDIMMPWNHSRRNCIISKLNLFTVVLRPEASAFPRHLLEAKLWGSPRPAQSETVGVDSTICGYLTNPLWCILKFENLLGCRNPGKSLIGCWWLTSRYLLLSSWKVVPSLHLRKQVTSLESCQSLNDRRYQPTICHSSEPLWPNLARHGP